MDIDDLYDLLIESLIYTYINTNTNTNILNNSLYDTSPIKYVITDEVKSNLIPIQFKDAKKFSFLQFKLTNYSTILSCVVKRILSNHSF